MSRNRFESLCKQMPVLLILAMSVSQPGCWQDKPPMPEPPPPTVTVARPIHYTVQSYYEYNGYLDAVEIVQIKARVKGFLNEVRFREGDEVKKGDLLFRIDPREYEANVKKVEADRLKALAEVRRSRSEETRARTLVASKALSAEELEQRVAARETAEAILKQTEAQMEATQLELSYTEMKAPISGQISRTYVTPGNLVGFNENTLLTTIVGVDPLYVYFDAAERDLVEYQQKLRTQALPSPISQELTVEVGVTSEEGYPHVGKIDFRENRVDAGTGTVRIRGRIPNSQVGPGNSRLLYPGLFARVRVPSGEPRPLPVLPEDALMTGQEGRYVYVVKDKNMVEKRTVVVGAQVFKGPAPKEGDPPGWELVTATATPTPAKGESAPPRIPVTSVVAIEKGVAPGDRVIVNGLTRARPGTPVAPDERELKAPAPAKKK